MGMFGFQESVYHRVPLVGIPIFGDQVDNVKRAVEKGVGIEISDKQHFKAKELKEKIETVIYDERYVCIEVALRGEAHGIGRSNWAKGRDPSGSWAQYPNPTVPPAPRHSRWIILTH